jgi:hypothetical protein
MNNQHENRSSNQSNTRTILKTSVLSTYFVVIYLVLGGCQTQESTNTSTNETGLDQAMSLDLGTQDSDSQVDQLVDATHSSCHELETETGCSDSEVCREGECVNTCETIDCDEGQVCQAGQCIDACETIDCDEGQVCQAGQCMDACETIDCDEGQICQAGQCMDACVNITCTEDMICVNGECVSPPSICDSFPQLDLSSYATYFGFETTIPSTFDQEQTDCIMNTYENGGDRTLSFTAPVAGTWLFTAKGFHLWSFSARTVCESTEVIACSGNVDFHGGNAFGSWQGFQIMMEEGETIYLNADGCPLGLGMRCDYTLKAIAPILEGDSCDPYGAQWRNIDDPINGCTEGLTCSTYLEEPVCMTAVAPEIIRPADARAWRVDDRLRVTLYGFDPNRDLRKVTYQLLNEQREPLNYQEGGTTEWLGQVRSSVRNVDSPILQFEVNPQASDPMTFLDQVSWIAVHLIDQEDLLSETLEIPIRQDIPQLNEDELCDPLEYLNQCTAPLQCITVEETAASCVVPIAPTIDTATFHMNLTRTRYAFTISAHDPHQDLSRWVQFTLLNAVGESVVEIDSYTRLDHLGNGSFSLVLDEAFARHQQERLDEVTEVEFVLFDLEGLESEAWRTTISLPAIRAQGEECELREVRNRCTDGLICDVNIEESITESSRICQPIIAQCPETWNVIDLNEYLIEELDQVWNYQGDLTDKPALASCDYGSFESQGTDVFQWTAPQSGSYQFIVQSSFDSLPVLVARRYCALANASYSELSCNERQDYHEGRVWTTLAVEADETIYLMVDHVTANSQYQLIGELE